MTAEIKDIKDDVNYNRRNMVDIKELTRDVREYFDFSKKNKEDIKKSVMVISEMVEDKAKEYEIKKETETISESALKENGELYLIGFCFFTECFHRLRLPEEVLRYEQKNDVVFWISTVINLMSSM